MQSVSAIALSGMRAGVASLGSSAHNIANLSTTGFKREVFSHQSASSGGVTSQVGRSPNPGNAMETDIVGLFSAEHYFLANLAVFRASDAMAGTLLDIGA